MASDDSRLVARPMPCCSSSLAHRVPLPFRSARLLDPTGAAGHSTTTTMAWVHPPLHLEVATRLLLLPPPRPDLALTAPFPCP